MNGEKKKYRALSGGLIARVGTREYSVEAGKVYEWGDEEAEIYLRNAPENFQLLTEQPPGADAPGGEVSTPPDESKSRAKFRKGGR